ncbi:hypothetical protein GNI_035750 [Gregarina niphandrodes]|uniref:Uncharacterized protein n=1 Tax=Gregarina niphandrodes TaxID=110365 RepID=A0A023BAQ2_GRENI|nr:hypothetical protein GNI_035750 [Gregarina niphandrodes]EZG78470.1 hypothetical protein GNI_035750 [Gregarina niphandrodes]|eukprot:XP_011129285.1 hypothetical protein GNI_035750 [Gregarina niphandrodes]
MVEEGGKTQSGQVENGSDFAAYRMIHATLTKAQWKKLRTVSAEDFQRFTPYGSVNQHVTAKIVEGTDPESWSTRLPWWITGCLLQHSGVSINSLAHFCLTDLKYDPYYDNAGLVCLEKSAVSCRELCDRDDFTDRLQKLKQRLAGLPTISATGFASQKNLVSECLFDDGDVWEHAWVSRYWEPLERAGYDRLTPIVSHDRQNRWRRSFTSGVVDGFESWSMCGKEGTTPVYMPSLSPWTPLGKRALGTELSDFEAYRMIYQSLSESQWKELKAVTAGDLTSCDLAYVELGAIISYFFDAPYGLLDHSIMKQLNTVMRLGQARLWVTGCLLQRTGVMIESLIDFCVNELNYLPKTGTERARQLECLHIDGFVHYCGRKNCTRFYARHALTRRLAGLPKVSAAQFATMEQSTVDNLCRPIALASKPSTSPSSDQPSDQPSVQPSDHPPPERKSSKTGAGGPEVVPVSGKTPGVIECEARWVPRYWRPLGEDEYFTLRGSMTGLAAHRRKRWRTLSRLFSTELDWDDWTMVSRDGRTRPLYIPTLTSAGKALPRELEHSFATNPFAAYRVVYSSLTEQEWKRLKTVSLEDFQRCKLAFVELGAIISTFFDDPYGMVDQYLTDKIVEAMRIGPTSGRIRFWIAGCLLQHSGVSIDHLCEFCITKLNYDPFFKRYDTRPLECLEKRHVVHAIPQDDGGVDGRLQDLRARIRRLPEVSVTEYAHLSKEELDQKMRQMNPPQMDPPKIDAMHVDTTHMEATSPVWRLSSSSDSAEIRKDRKRKERPTPPLVKRRWRRSRPQVIDSDKDGRTPPPKKQVLARGVWTEVYDDQEYFANRELEEVVRTMWREHYQVLSSCLELLGY